MRIGRRLAAIVAVGLLGLALAAGSAQAVRASKSPKPKDYTYCFATATEQKCSEKPFELFHRTLSWSLEGTSGTYTVTGKSYVFRENGNTEDELRGTRGKHGVISGNFYQHGAPIEDRFTLIPVPKS